MNVNYNEYLQKSIKRMCNIGHVYIATDGTYCKIGYSSDVAERVRILNTSSPNEIQLLYAFKCFDPNLVEAHLHDKFKRQQVKGEWFVLYQDDLSQIITYARTKLIDPTSDAWCDEVARRIKAWAIANQAEVKK